MLMLLISETNVIGDKYRKHRLWF